MNMKRTIAAVTRAPRLAGESIPNMANTREREGGRERGRGEKGRGRNVT